MIMESNTDEILFAILHPRLLLLLPCNNALISTAGICETGISPDGGSYSLRSIKGAIKDAIGYTPYIECNVDPSGNSQLYQVYLCVDTSATQFIECPVFPKGKCGSEIEFPTF